jgi:starch phosphorylase
MTAAMNGTINLSIPDGWVPEFAKQGKNSFVIQPANDLLAEHAKDKIEAQHLLDLLENEIIPMYYEKPEQWLEVMKASMKDVLPYFDSGRMVKEYYDKLYI